MKILSVDTSSSVCSIAILDDLNVLYECSNNDNLTHSQNLMPMIDEAFKKSSLSLEDINLYTCSIGPGSFTGIRIGVSTVKAFVDVYGKPAVGISSLEGLAYNINSEYVCSIIDAKHDNIYYSLFKKDNNNIYTPLIEHTSSDINSAINNLLKYNDNMITFIGDGSITYKDSILGIIKNCNFVNNSLNMQNATSIGKAAYLKYVNHINVDDLSPLYLKKSQAEIMLEKKI